MSLPFLSNPDINQKAEFDPYVNKLICNDLQVLSGATNGDVLTSDASGNATWQVPSGGGSTPTFTSVNGNTFYAAGQSSVIQLGVRNLLLVNISAAKNLLSSDSGSDVALRSNFSNLTINLPVIGITEGRGSWYQFTIQSASPSKTITINSVLNVGTVTPQFQGNVNVMAGDGTTPNTSLHFDGTKTILTWTASRGDQLTIYSSALTDVWFITGGISSSSTLVAS